MGKEILNTALISFSLTIIGLSLGFLLLKIQGEETSI
uniref:Cytochrome b6-f complex subunit 7 n=1 Tax=Cyanoptyche gloeocystis TaxID=77922 RepID=A0A3G1IWB3_9EUKA|nr:cytochrome b6-f complex subunit VII [Cyanoptyche gloeocystis]